MTEHSVLLVEDQDATRECLARVIAGHPQLCLLAAVGDCAAARDWLRRQPPDVLLTDLDLPDGNGLELIRETHRQHPATEIMVITVFGDEEHVIRAIEAGAAGYLLKDGGADYIGQSIMQLLGGGSPISASIARYLLKRFQPGGTPTPPAAVKPPVAAIASAPATGITERELQVLRLVAKGFSYGEIAGLLNLSVHTVTTHIKQIYRKLAVRSRGEAVYEALQLGLIQFDE